MASERNLDIWRLDAEAATLLAPLASPFADERFLEALERFDSRYKSKVIGARADDGARALFAATLDGHEACSVPFGYGGIVADRALEKKETDALLRLAASQLGASRVRSRYVPLPIRGRPTHAGGSVIASTAVVLLTGSDADFESRLAKKARQSIRRAERAGVVVASASDPSQFLSIYERASQRFQTVYPAGLIRLVASSGIGRSYDATIGDDVVASALVLTGPTEWMYWLAGETDRGRRAEAGYPIVARLIADARDAGVGFVNLGASAGLPGVAKFKRRLASVDLPVIEQSVALSPRAFVSQSLLNPNHLRAAVRRLRKSR